MRHEGGCLALSATLVPIGQQQYNQSTNPLHYRAHVQGQACDQAIILSGLANSWAELCNAGTESDRENRILCSRTTQTKKS